MPKKQAEMTADEQFEAAFNSGIANEPAAQELVEETPAEEAPTEVPPVEEAATEVVEETTPPAAEPAPAADDWEQKYKSYKGVFDSELKRMQEKEKQYNLELEKLRAEVEGKQGRKEEIPPPEAAPPPVVQEEDPEINAFFENYPDIAKPQTKLMQQELTKFTQALADQLAKRDAAFLQMITPLIEGDAAKKAQGHFERIKQSHGDFEALRDSGEITKWIEEQPSYMRKALHDVYAGGSADDVIDLIGRFKQAKGQAQPPPPNAEMIAQEAADEMGNVALRAQQGNLDKLRTIEAVKKQSTTPMPRAVRKDDFDAAFDEAVRGLGA